MIKALYLRPPCALFTACIYSDLIPFALGCCFFFNDPATTEIYTLSLHDALPIYDAPLTARYIHRRHVLWLVYGTRSEEHTSELQSHSDLVCRLLLEKKKRQKDQEDQDHDYRYHRARIPQLQLLYRQLDPLARHCH